MANFPRKKFGDLQAIEIKGTRPDAPTLVFFHGYGADCEDLAPFAKALAVPRDVNWLFPDGLVPVPVGGHREGRGWFPLSLATLEQAQAADGTTGFKFSHEAPAGLRKAREAALGALSAAGVRLGNAILVGFSQGAVLAMDLAVRGPEAPLGVALLSGTLVDEPNLRRLAALRPGTTFFQSHGVRDPVLSITGAEGLEAVLLENGWKGKLQRFEGQHEIPLEVQSTLSAYLRARILEANPTK